MPALDSLAIRFHETDGETSLAEGKHTRRIVVEHAAAYFEIPCADRDCEGMHDLTQDLLRELRSWRGEFAGKHRCDGGHTAKACGRVLCWSALAKYAS